MTANNMRELEQMLLREARKAMVVASDKILADMYDETEKFYTKGNPKMYQRTGALGDTPKTTAISSFGNEVSFDAYLDTSHGYTTGSKPSMTQVLNLANYGTPFTTKNDYPSKPTLGKKGFWERAEKKMQRTLDRTMKKFFK